MLIFFFNHLALVLKIIITEICALLSLEHTAILSKQQMDKKKQQQKTMCRLCCWHPVSIYILPPLALPYFHFAMA